MTPPAASDYRDLVIEGFANDLLEAEDQVRAYRELFLLSLERLGCAQRALDHSTSTVRRLLDELRESRRLAA